MSDWPELPYETWRETRDTLHMYLQIVGKVRLTLAPMEPQWGQVPLYVTARGLNTSPIPHANGVFDIDVDFTEHSVSVRTVAGALERVTLEPRSVADFYALLMTALDRAGVPTTITERPSEVPDPIPFSEDTVHASYDREAVTRFWRALTSIDAVMKEHRARFLGRVSPVQFFWGTFDLAYTRFSGRPAEPPPGRRRDHAQRGERRGDVLRLLARRRSASPSRPSSPTRIRPRPGSKRKPRTGTRSSASSFFPTKPSVPRPTRVGHCWTSSSPRTAQRVGIRLWKRNKRRSRRRSKKYARRDGF